MKELTVGHLKGWRLPTDTEDDLLLHDTRIHVAEEQKAPQIQVKVEALKHGDKQELMTPNASWGMSYRRSAN
jgi:hypothetical protein